MIEALRLLPQSAGEGACPEPLEGLGWGFSPPHKGCAKLCSDETRLAAILSAEERTAPSTLQKAGVSDRPLRHPYTCANMDA